MIHEVGRFIGGPVCVAVSDGGCRTWRKAEVAGSGKREAGSGLNDYCALDDDVKRPRKSLQPLVLVIHDCLLRARSLASVIPTVR